MCDCLSLRLHVADYCLTVTGCIPMSVCGCVENVYGCVDKRVNALYVCSWVLGVLQWVPEAVVVRIFEV